MNCKFKTLGTGLKIPTSAYVKESPNVEGFGTSRPAGDKIMYIRPLVAEKMCMDRRQKENEIKGLKILSEKATDCKSVGAIRYAYPAALG